MDFTYKTLQTTLPYDIPTEDSMFKNLTLIPFDDQPWILQQKHRRPPTQKLIHTQYPYDLYPPNLTCEELEHRGFCQRTYYATKVNQRVLTEQIQLNCPYLCNHHDRTRRTTLTRCNTITATEDCYDLQTIEQCQQNVCNTENCKVTENTCSQDTYLGYIYMCKTRSNMTLWNYEQPKLQKEKSTHQANWMQYHPHTSIVKGYAISAITWNINRTSYRPKALTKEHLWAVYNYITTICTTTTSNCYQAQQTPIYKKGAQFQWEIVHATWTANQPTLKGDQFQNCLSFMGQETDNNTLQILQSYHIQDMPVTANLTTKQEYFADGFATLCPRLNQWIIFKRPEKHTLTPFQLKQANVTITITQNLIEIHKYNLTLPILKTEKRDGKQYFITQTHQLITPPEITPDMLRYQPLPELFREEITNQQRHNIEQQWKQQRQIQVLQTQVAQLQQLTAYQQLRTKQLGDLTAHYECRKIKNYQPVWSRRLDQYCYHQLPIIHASNNAPPAFSMCMETVIASVPAAAHNLY